MDETLARWNESEPAEAAKEILPCCGSNAWAEGMVSKRPFDDEAAVLITADEVWRKLGPPDWLEAFKAHPKSENPELPNQRESALRLVRAGAKKRRCGAGRCKLRLAEGNQAYEEKSGSSSSCARQGSPLRKFWRF